MESPVMKKKEKIKIVSPENTLSNINSSSSGTNSSSSILDLPLTLDDNLEEGVKCTNDNFYSKECNNFLLKKELIERNVLEKDDHPYLYPNLNDKNFNIKIANKKEFNETKYDGTIHENIKEQAEILAKSDFELSPHQAFVKNFLSFQTPYSSLLLFHGLGTGKTCSAIGVCEEMRDYMKQTGITKRIIIVASENVQNNFRSQLFDERKLSLVDGLWDMKTCIGNKLLKEINPMNTKGMSEKKVISQVKNLINSYYIFMGYLQFANYIIKTIGIDDDLEINKKTDKRVKDTTIELNNRAIRRLRNEFNDRLIVIDEVHNIRQTDDNENKKVANNLELLVKVAENMRFLLLSATPMYNSYKEITWLLNLMNTNDRRGKFHLKDIFEKNGEFKKDGEELLIRKATGYVSFVRGENPYTFPYRVYPNLFDSEKSFPKFEYPTHQMNLKKIKHEDRQRILSLYLTEIGGCNNCGDCQYCAYRYIIYKLRKKKFQITTKMGVQREMPDFASMESFGYTLLLTPIEALIISYPMSELKKVIHKIKDEPLSHEFSPSFSEIESEKKEVEVDKAPGFMEEPEEPEVIEDVPVVIEEVEPEKEVVMKRKRCPKGTRMNKITEECEKIVEKKTEKVILLPEILPEVLEEEEIVLPELITEGEVQEVTTKRKRCPKGTRMNKKTKECEKIKGGGDGEEEEDEQEEDEEQEEDDDELEEPETTFDHRKLTGKTGLTRMMEITEGKDKIEIKYKPSTLKEYGHIFSQEMIGKYSAKIKSILDNIYNSQTNNVSSGIILIYSQYIFSGLIPMALALEEMGFTRYGNGTRTLFKSKSQADLIDVRTMNKDSPNGEKKMYARYSMITGDPRLSPDNDFEVKGLTSNENVHGNKVKVVLISRAGSEGIDFKYIRQVHILDPWYNMNRNEQIIGRAVRNFSHKDLPFEERNVQIFMHGTILKSTKEEAADLYIYRAAEYKAKQIGKITRILKETAVDCIINHGQTNFTQDKMKKILKGNIRQELSDGTFLRNFRVGDAPFSPACDYMANCDYNCRPFDEIDEDNLNEDTYSEKFINSNSERIIERIRMLMKEGFFYKKEILIKSIRAQREYPYIQIYSALTHLIDDSNEIIKDRYGRDGRLINIGEYYLFQPLELKDKSVSIFERSVPIDFKHDMIEFEMKKDALKPSKKRVLHKSDEQIESADKFIEGKKFVDEMKTQFETSKEYLMKKVVPRGDKDWYKHCGIVIKFMTKQYPDTKIYLLKFLVAHLMESLVFEEKIEVMNYLYSLPVVDDSTFEWFAKDYILMNTIQYKEMNLMIMYKLDKKQIMKLVNEKWIPATPSEIRDIDKNIQNDTNQHNYNKIVGFIGYGRGNKALVFKTKDMTSGRDTGARCDEAGKPKILQKLNLILGENTYTNENVKVQKDGDGNVIQEAFDEKKLCILLEFLLRYFSIIEKDGKKYFLTPESAIAYPLYKLFV